MLFSNLAKHEAAGLLRKVYSLGQVGVRAGNCLSCDYSVLSSQTKTFLCGGFAFE